MIDLDSVEKYWPLIAENPWAFAWVFITGLAIGIGAHKLWGTLTSSRAKTVASTPAKTGQNPARNSFKPDRLQVSCIAMLRHFDDEWITQDQISQGLDSGTPRADIRQALEGLIAAGWVLNRLSTIHPTEYRLKDPGLNYARERNFNVRVRT